MHVMRYTEQGNFSKEQRVICIEHDAKTKNYVTEFTDWYIIQGAQNDMHRKIYINQY